MKYGDISGQQTHTFVRHERRGGIFQKKIFRLVYFSSVIGSFCRNIHSITNDVHGRNYSPDESGELNACKQNIGPRNDTKTGRQKHIKIKFQCLYGSALVGLRAYRNTTVYERVIT